VQLTATLRRRERAVKSNEPAVTRSIRARDVALLPRRPVQVTLRQSFGTPAPARPFYRVVGVSPKSEEVASVHVPDGVETKGPNHRVGSLAARLRYAANLLGRRLRVEWDAPISLSQASALRTLYPERELTIGELARIELVQPATMTAAVDRLERRGYVRRRPDRKDKRMVRVGITAAGRSVVELARSHETAFLEQRLAELSDSERATLDAAIDILLSFASGGTTDEKSARDQAPAS
jgi:DNA-binding MarR family transcriptional regulator